MDMGLLMRGVSEGAMLLVRTDFSDDAAWLQVRERVVAAADFGGDDGDDDDDDDDDDDEDSHQDDLYEPQIEVVDDARFDGASATAIAASWDREDESALGYPLLADARSMAEADLGPALTVAVVDVAVTSEDEEEFGDVFGRAFRCVASEVASIEVNLDLGNVDFAELADAADESGGVLRGSKD